MLAGASIADAEMAAVLQCVMAAGRQDIGRAPAVLVIGDSHSVLWAVEKAWRTGSAWRVREIGHRREMLEAICLERLRWQRELGGGRLDMLWVPSHSGVAGNSMADTVAKAYIDEVAVPVGAARKAALVRYYKRVDMPGGAPGVWSHQAADRRVRGLVQRGVQQHVVRQLLAYEDDAAGRARREFLLLDIPDEAGQPQAMCGLPGRLVRCWAKIVQLTGGDDKLRGGHRGAPTATGAVLRVRSDHLGLPGDAGAGGVSARAAIGRVWHADEGSGGSAAARRAMHAATVMHDALAQVEQEDRASSYHATLLRARAVLGKLRQGRVADISEEDWLVSRRVAGGFLPEPSAAEWQATEDEHADDDLGAHKRGSAREEAIRVVRDSVWQMASAMASTAAEWRERHGGGVWRGMRDEDDDVDDGVHGEAPAETAARADGEPARQPAAEERVELAVPVVAVAGTLRDPGGRSVGVCNVNIMRRAAEGLGNPFPMGQRGSNEERRGLVVWLFRDWLRRRDLPAEQMTLAGGEPLPGDLVPMPRDKGLTGAQLLERLRAAVTRCFDAQGAAHRRLRTIRFECTGQCGAKCDNPLQPDACHGIALAEHARPMADEEARTRHDAALEQEARRAAAAPEKAARPRGGARGPRQERIDIRQRVGYVNLLRFRHGSTRQVSQRVTEAMATSEAPWLAGLVAHGARGRDDDDVLLIDSDDDDDETGATDG